MGPRIWSVRKSGVETVFETGGLRDSCEPGAKVAGAYAQWCVTAWWRHHSLDQRVMRDSPVDTPEKAKLIAERWLDECAVEKARKDGAAMSANDFSTPHPDCKAKHTRYQPSEAEWRCPKCGADAERFIIDESDEDVHDVCSGLHDSDRLWCGRCEASRNGRQFAAMLERKNNLVPCPHCKGKGLVKAKTGTTERPHE